MFTLLSAIMTGCAKDEESISAEDSSVLMSEEGAVLDDDSTILIVCCRNWGVSNRYKVQKLNQLIRGRVNHFKKPGKKSDETGFASMVSMENSVFERICKTGPLRRCAHSNNQ